jgi:regulator of cell morphogenesis and NO signaling
MAKDFETWNGEQAELDRCKTIPLGELIRHIVEQYHREARIEMARLETLVEEAVLMEGHDFPELLPIRVEVEQFCAELRAHMKHEEREVFPALLDMEEGAAARVPDSVRDPLRLLQDEHTSTAGLTERIRLLTEGFNPPQGARGLQRRLYQAFQLLADSLQRHIYLENRILFKRVLHHQD